MSTIIKSGIFKVNEISLKPHIDQMKSQSYVINLELENATTIKNR